MRKTRWFKLTAAMLFMLCPALGFSHIHINPIVDQAKSISDFATSWSSFQNLANTLKGTAADLRKKEDILKLQSLGADLKKRLPSVQQNLQTAVRNIAESGNDTPAFDTSVAEDMAKIPAAAGINSTIRQLSGARAAVKGFQADTLGTEIDNIIAEITGGAQKPLRTTARPSCELLAVLDVLSLVSECAQCGDIAKSKFSESRCASR